MDTKIRQKPTDKQFLQKLIEYNGYYPSTANMKYYMPYLTRFYKPLPIREQQKIILF